MPSPQLRPLPDGRGSVQPARNRGREGAVFRYALLLLLALTTSRAQTYTPGPQVLTFFSLVVAAAEVVVGLAIIVHVYRRRRSADVDDLNLLKW